MIRFWPDARQTLLLRAALLEGPGAEAAWRRWSESDGGLDAVGGLSFRLLPLVYRNLARNGVEDSVLPRLKGVYRYAWYQNQRILHEAAHALLTLRDAGIETMTLKGIPLAELYYRDSGARPMGDVDVAVRPQEAVAAVGALRAAGWTLGTPLAVERVVRTFHSKLLVGRDGLELDLHWSVMYEPGPDAELWRAAVPLAVRGAPTLALCPADQLLHACVHAFGESGARLRWIADAMTIARTAGPELDWDRLVEQAIARRVTPAAGAALDYLVEAFGLAVPDRVLAELAAVRPTPRERFAHLVAGSAPPHGAGIVKLWDRYRRLRTFDHECPRPNGFLEMLADHWELPRRRDLVPQLARRAVKIGARSQSQA